MDRDSREEVVSNLPNILSFFRLVCIPLVVISLYFEGKPGSLLAALFFGLAFVTDILDGFFARRYGAVTVLGKFLDPMADKILVSATMIMLIPLNRIPAWVVIIIIAREIAVTGLRSIAVSDGTVIQASSLGKYKTIFQSVAVIGLCLHYEYYEINFHAVGMAFLWIALVLTIWSGWAYFRKFNRVFSPKEDSPKVRK
ncbi:MAG: CDP-diacylglycerol--glycerol-3-phosphate 3-phosphatidyltransferase [Deltaproteobacteria bacterium]|nr:CDP-diacylglycerol--glycerol-3-phosphate 3-phosphatidyltransferase [Deltaproteobacteria bacterium]MBW2136885.1 CDP-diacylglycerol--glycerol-3-phosphate 3-phosphatidyltransferase [Deltaproteobacteria bacterium]